MTSASLAVRFPSQSFVPSQTQRWGAIEIFVLMAYFSPVLLFLPKAQAFRVAIRGLPYAASLLMLAWWFTRGALFSWERPGVLALACSLAILAIGLAHPDTSFFSGTAQIFFQLSILGPFFWIGNQVTDPERVRRLLGLIFLGNAASAILGLLQFHYPEHFMPILSQDLVRIEGYLEGLTYVDAGGRKVFRPPGLTDMPGGASAGCAVTAVLGLLFAADPGKRSGYRGVCVVLVGMALYTLYLTLVRSLLISALFAITMAVLLLVRQGRSRQGLLLGISAAFLVVGSFLVAVISGGVGILQRFMGLIETGVFAAYQHNRGDYLKYTFGEAIFEYPFGAGLGRWSMMGYHFSRFDANPSPPLYAEIQVTGWVMDGGMPLLIASLAAIGGALFGLYRLAALGTGPLAYLALVAFCANLIVVSQANSAPTFNMSLGMQFWLVAGLVFRAAESVRKGPRANASKAATRSPL
jgi:hypothetical protein